MSAAEQRSALVAGAIAAGANKKAVDAAVTGAGGGLVVHPPETVSNTRVGADDILDAAKGTEALIIGADDGLVRLEPVRVGEKTSVVEAFVSDEELGAGTARDWWILLGIMLGLVLGSVIVVDRLARGAVASVRNLVHAAMAVGGGDLGVRIQPSGPRELAEAGYAFNRMADRLVTSRTSERELVADLSHRLRTPLTALRLDADAMPPGPIGERMRQAFDALDDEIEQIITTARRSAADRVPESTDLVEVVADRLAFWSVLAEDQQRPWRVVGGQEPVWVPVAESDLVSAVDCMLGNVFQHTPEGTGFEVHVSPRGLTVDDAGPGIADPAKALRRGSSGAGSTGLGLDIVRRVAETAGGRLVVERGPLRGARVAIVLEPMAMTPPRPQRRVVR
jgi:signal transduction histidine kinase